ncbi:MAG: hypothetical protein A2725_01020 [Candidatus Magasanikbacteria bacterium RIFCSPHIGHO2_01_FULL_33_34]|uniref:Xylose isomerase-like TIM barrel domain-containing protein n=1 Tax=Candidatus Magasanikbacteria bacterium RIFCSPHIGHO2_01_FULL_33_34 TaxID=1798671 RepID=A0A1F6LJC9_9BACT|nr:MAG: hypothetical protein A2725_01020 [Candidatus Magasanikbacteria bacterium RIFCSPHIGHO2_01_FULL_33_34]OGH65337.1 MAG: hypothetical protein A3B83_04680 [Candidatus Magasanikbacteria bacterium RIFCSPHIGHO2_02_FULL_33_17]OGH76113.1 MAG: hypothetical protein A3A89_01600 [Candidatus Magasanikbacteria bacterium RIFCSPLOWO2_01_FULL_33_34]OGH81085.1 MAG: hypothetical protein A3F93_02900 [Candidatus Magasanikbacteria bacterium RIFCSPLOWO2_12_FULL_34_7]
MIKYGLKIWSNNTHLFDEAVERYKKGYFDFAEVYSNSEFEHDYDALNKLKELSVQGVHVGHLDKAGFHNFFLTEEQKKPWNMTIELSNFFDAPRIIVHPAVEHNWESFQENLAKIDDPRILIESMPIVSPFDSKLRKFGGSLDDLRKIYKQKPICLDISKFIKACVYYKLDYKNSIEEALKDLQPEYFHISGCSIDNPIDEHGNLYEANFDVSWVYKILEKYAKDKDIFLVFETPKVGMDLENDIKNMDFFRK